MHVPFALPGETVRITREGERGTLLDIIEASARARRCTPSSIPSGEAWL